jgi:phage terminase large subunit
MLSPDILSKLRRWKESPLTFAVECIGMQPSDQQAELFYAFGQGNKRITVRSGHGTGKDASVGGVIIPWFMITRPYAKVICTAPTARQLSDILWTEISKWLRQSVLSDDFVIQKDKIYYKDAPKEWWVRAVSPSVKASKEEQAETLAGFHGEHLLIVVDEASGVPDPVYTTLEGALTQEDNYVVLIGNMTKNQGYFYDTHFHPELSKRWWKLHWDSRKSSNVQPGYVEYMKVKYGENSNVFRIRVTGDPPLEDSTVLIPLAWAEQCIGNDIEVPEDEPLYLGVDVARYGDDYSIILPRRGNEILPWEKYQSINTITLGGFISQTYQEMYAEGLAIDEIGVGAGVTDWLSKRNIPGLFGVNVSSESWDITKADRLRDELWLTVREKCLNRQYSFPDTIPKGDYVSLGQELANELSSPTYDFNRHGGIVVESKKHMKSRGIASPNIADALCLSEYFNATAHHVWPKDKKNRRGKVISLQERYGQNAWQVA